MVTCTKPKQKRLISYGTHKITQTELIQVDTPKCIVYSSGRRLQCGTCIPRAPAPTKSCVAYSYGRRINSGSCAKLPAPPQPCCRID